MLKALELVGFKSFADKTRFEFPRGITAVVGPNGSGKSNVVDAIKWVLGEQSVKSLRGKEMADVIFNGSGGRAPLHSAETTLTFDNADGLLPIDTPEVQISRRVYRSGEGEYLINRQPCRLRDIRDLFSGTGAATEAYSVIEQGKVDVLLQSSPRERRVIFEEAAGISRFKAKKIESLRRLERVEQNLLRLADIVDEVENQLRSVRKQATKAQRYKEYGDRLQGLRTQVGLADWRQLGKRLESLSTAAAGLAADVSSQRERADALEANAEQIETQLGDLGEQARDCEGRVAEDRERIASFESKIEHERERLAELEREQGRHRSQLAALMARAGSLQQHWRATAAAVEVAQTEHRAISQYLVAGERALSDLTSRWKTLRDECDRARSAHVDLLRTVAALEKEITAAGQHAAAAQAAVERCDERGAELKAQAAAAEAEIAQLETQLADQLQQLAQRGQRVAAHRQTLAASKSEHAAAVRELGPLRERHSGASERAALLAELEARQEGLATGVRDLLQRAQTGAQGAFGQIRGLVADLMRAGVEMAPLIDVALGPQSQYLVVDAGTKFLAELNPTTMGVQGRVGFVPLDSTLPPQWLDEIDLSHEPGVVGSALQQVETSPEYAGLARRLLGRTWIVERLEHALHLFANVAPGLQYVTLAGELVAPDGTVVMGPPHGAAGLISRKSELRALGQEVAELEHRIAAQQRLIEQTTAAVAAAEHQLERELESEQAGQAELAELRLGRGAAEERRRQLTAQLAACERDRRRAEQDEAASGADLTAARGQLATVETDLAERDQELAAAQRALEALEAEKQLLTQQATGTQVQGAKSEERLANLRAQLQQLEQDHEERNRAITERREHLADSQRRGVQAQWAILAAESQLALLYLSKEEQAQAASVAIGQREELRPQRAALLQEAQGLRASVRKLEEEQHAEELSASEVRFERDTLASRLREDYGIELAELEHHPTADELQQREQVDEEIADLRRRLASIGSVNLSALEELGELEQRYESLSTQFKDLSSAKRALEQIIQRINADSRRLLSESIETVRGHFQELFRKLFGGGHADVVLEEGVDILDCGIEIIARPPGKEPRSISLLSGGEKTLTCVALLLAIFRSRPSPFCVLDEVDAALDEANIQRFIGVLQEFLAWTQFIIVTHSKKTMTCAQTLYGVTMQESGVSKRVSVRFEDVSDNGEFRVSQSPASRGSAAEQGGEAEADDETQAA